MNILSIPCPVYVLLWSSCNGCKPKPASIEAANPGSSPSTDDSGEAGEFLPSAKPKCSAWPSSTLPSPAPAIFRSTLKLQLVSGHAPTQNKAVSRLPISCSTNAIEDHTETAPALGPFWYSRVCGGALLISKHLQWSPIVQARQLLSNRQRIEGSEGLCRTKSYYKVRGWFRLNLETAGCVTMCEFQSGEGCEGVTVSKTGAARLMTTVSTCKRTHGRDWANANKGLSDDNYLETMACSMKGQEE